MKFLDYIKLANTYVPPQTGQGFSIGLVTNFTDDVLAKVLIGVAVSLGLSPEIYKAPYKQYGFALKDSTHALWQSRQLTFFFFDINFYLHSEFSESDEYAEALLGDLENFASKFSGTVVVNTFILPYGGPRGNHVLGQPLFERAQRLNGRLWELAKKYRNLEVFDINRLVHKVGERAVRDMRGMYAFDTPFTHDFLVLVAEEWAAYILALSGKAKKVIVLDMDNTLWGGVVGEAGPLGIALGPNYPGVAFQNFQRALLKYQQSGVLLAINSKNNLADVEEVWEKNPHMILKKEHFAAIFANWEDKVNNFLELSKKLNLGLDSFIFLDDEPVQRDSVRKRLPQVLVPELPSEAENYAAALYDLAVFSPFASTGEDARKNEQYQEEQKRQELQKSVANLPDFIASLKMEIKVSVNPQQSIPRISQLTLKTNQFNVTTRRYSESEIEKFMEQGVVAAANVEDKFGDYGLTALAIIKPQNSGEYLLDSFLMSCRVLGRGVEFSFLDFIVRGLREQEGAKILLAEFIPTAKNAPAQSFFKEFGFKEKTGGGPGHNYELDIEAYCHNSNPKVYQSIITKGI